MELIESENLSYVHNSLLGHHSKYSEPESLKTLETGKCSIYAKILGSVDIHSMSVAESVPRISSRYGTIRDNTEPSYAEFTE